MSLKASGGWLREMLSISMCSEYLEDSFKNYPPETTYDGNCNVQIIQRDLDILVVSKVSQKEFDINAH